MLNIWELAEEYEESAGRLRDKLAEFREERPHVSESEIASINKRRMELYHMLWEMEEKIRLLREYREDRPADSGSAWLNGYADSGYIVKVEITPVSARVGSRC